MSAAEVLNALEERAFDAIDRPESTAQSGAPLVTIKARALVELVGVAQVAREVSEDLTVAEPWRRQLRAALDDLGRVEL